MKIFISPFVLFFSLFFFDADNGNARFIAD